MKIYCQFYFRGMTLNFLFRLLRHRCKMIHYALFIILCNVFNFWLFVIILVILITHMPVTFVDKNQLCSFRQNREILNCAWSDSKCYTKCWKWPHFHQLFKKILFYWVLYPGLKLFNGKAFLKCNYLQNIFLIQFLIISQEPKKVIFLAMYTSSMRHASNWFFLLCKVCEMLRKQTICVRHMLACKAYVTNLPVHLPVLFNWSSVLTAFSSLCYGI